MSTACISYRANVAGVVVSIIDGYFFFFRCCVLVFVTVALSRAHSNKTEQKGKHAFKFIVDDEWRFAPDQPTVADIEGRVNNFIDVSDFVGYTGEENFEANRLKVRQHVRSAWGGGGVSRMSLRGVLV